MSLWQFITWKSWTIFLATTMVLGLGIAVCIDVYIPYEKRKAVRQDMFWTLNAVIERHEKGELYLEDFAVACFWGIGDTWDEIYVGKNSPSLKGICSHEQLLQAKSSEECREINRDSRFALFDNVWSFFGKFLNNCEDIIGERTIKGKKLKFRFISHETLELTANNNSKDWQFFEIRADGGGENGVNYRLLIDSIEYNKSKPNQAFYAVKDLMDLLVVGIFIYVVVIIYALLGGLLRGVKKSSVAIIQITEKISNTEKLEMGEYPREYRALVQEINKRNMQYEAVSVRLVEEIGHLARVILHDRNDGSGGPAGDMYREDLIKSLKKAEDRLSAATRQMLQISRGEESQSQTPDPVGKVLHACKCMLKSEYKEVEVEVDYLQGAAELMPRNRWFGEIIKELARNAAKYSRGKNVDEVRKVRLKASRVKGGVKVTVENTGGSFPPEVEKRERLLDWGVRSESSEYRDVPGTGLGLATVQRWLTAGGGTIELGDSADLKGASVTIKIVAS